jgi:putative RecB family exonuclease
MSTVLKLLRDDAHVSVSSLQTYLKCPAQFEHRYVRKTPAENRPGALAFGSAIHAALAHYYSSLRTVGSAPTAEELSQIFCDNWQRETAATPPLVLGDGETVGRLADTGVAMLAVFAAQVVPPAAVTDVEMPFAVEVGEDGTRLVGVLDAVVSDEDGVYRILEHKTAGRRWTPDRIASDLQVTAYSLAAPMLGLGHDAAVDVQLLLKTKRPAFEVLHTARTDADRCDLVATVSGVTKAIKAGAFYPMRDWHCRGCQYAGACVAG